MSDPTPNPRRTPTVAEPTLDFKSRAPRAATVQEPLPSPPGGVPPAARREAGPEESRSWAAEPADDTQPFRPIRRPPMALLHVLDDGEETGEVIRIRKDVFTIGRVSGDFVVPHDVGMSGQHVEISRREVGGRIRWQLRDLKSTNGTFIRASTVILRVGQEVMLGGLRLSFEPPAAQGAAPSAEGYAGTQKFASLTSKDIQAASWAMLVEQVQGGEGRRFSLPTGDSTIGRDASRCSIVIDDPMVSPVHATVRHEAQAGRWAIRNSGSLNGLWVRIDETLIDRAVQFQCGEQRFKLSIP